MSASLARHTLLLSSATDDFDACYLYSPSVSRRPSMMSHSDGGCRRQLRARGTPDSVLRPKYSLAAGTLPKLSTNSMLVSSMHDSDESLSHRMKKSITRRQTDPEHACKRHRSDRRRRLTGCLPNKRQTRRHRKIGTHSFESPPIPIISRPWTRTQIVLTFIMRILTSAWKCLLCTRHTSETYGVETTASGTTVKHKALETPNKRKKSSVMMNNNSDSDSDDRLTCTDCWAKMKPNKETTDKDGKKYLAAGFDEERYRSAVKKRPCRMTFLFDPSGQILYVWRCVVALAFLYNLWVIGYRWSFDEITKDTMVHWFICDYTADLIYVIDLALGFRTAFFTDGVLQTSPAAIREYFVNTGPFYMDCLALLPLDILYLSFGFNSLLRSIRLVKAWKYFAFIDVSERHISLPNLLRIVNLAHNVALMIHWNACVLYTFRPPKSALQISNSTIPLFTHHDVVQDYLMAIDLSCRYLLLINVPQEHDILAIDATTRIALLLSICQRLCGIFLVAMVVGTVTNIITNRNLQQKRFQSDYDTVKTYMSARDVPSYLRMKVSRWFDHAWRCNTYGEDQAALKCLPDKIKAEITIQVHLETLKRVEIFRNTEPGFLCELVLRLQPVLCSPGDYVCRKGEVGREMYIVDSGKLHVLCEDQSADTSVLATLTSGAYFGEISLLNVAGCDSGNRRTATVISVGYTQLLCLSKKHINEVLEEYPLARERLEEIARKRILERDQFKLMRQMQRSGSTAPDASNGSAVMPVPIDRHRIQDEEDEDLPFNRRESAPAFLVHKLVQPNRSVGLAV